MTAVANAAFAAAQFNTHLRDNLNETAPAKATTAGAFFTASGLNSIAERYPNSAFIATQESTTSLSYGDLATVGPTVSSVVSGGRVLIITTAFIFNSTAGSGGRVSLEISGDTSVSPVDTDCLAYESGNASDVFQGSWVTLHGSINPGTNTYRHKYRAHVSGTASFGNRVLSVVPF